jgi:Recombination endonuclease VII
MLNFLDPDKTTPTGVSLCRLMAVLASILRILAISVLVRYSIISLTGYCHLLAVDNSAGCVTTKKCTKCDSEKELSEFHEDKRNKDNASSWCKECRKVVRLRRYRENPDRQKENSRRWRRANPGWKKLYNLKKNYNLTIDQYSAILAKQGNRCAISGEKLGTGNKRAAVDHDHALGQVRGIIQQRFNVAEGHLKTPEDALKLYNYMLKNELFYSAVQN